MANSMISDVKSVFLDRFATLLRFLLPQA